MKLLTYISSITIASALLSCSSKPSASTQILPVNQQEQPPSILAEYFSQQFPPNEPGGSVLVMVSDSVVFADGFGLSNIQTSELATTKTLFNLGSISKTFVANAILILQERGKLSVDDNLLKYFPGFKNKEIARTVRIKHLLTHTSGLPDVRYPWKDSVFYLTAKDQENWAPIMKASQLNFEPGARFEYSNPAFNALALIVEQASGKKWQTFVAEEILIPSGMKSSTITDGPHPQTGVAHGYIKAMGGWIEKDYGEELTFAAAGNGGVWSSVEELALYEKALQKAVFLKPETIAESFQVKNFDNWTSGTQPQIGWSWFIGKTKEGYKTIGHTGSQGGFRANYVSVPEKKWLIIILSSAPRPLEKHTERILDFLQTGK